MRERSQPVFGSRNRLSVKISMHYIDTASFCLNSIHITHKIKTFISYLFFFYLLLFFFLNVWVFCFFTERKTWMESLLMSTLFCIWLFAVGASCSQTQHRIIWVPRKKEGGRKRKETCKQKRRRKCLKKFLEGDKNGHEKKPKLDGLENYG